MSAHSSNVYEQWVLGLRAWRSDPLTDLSHLPALDERSFPPTTFNRLISHLNEAINEYMRRWNQQLATALGGANSPHALARALVDARIGLAHRLRLARHPAFPEQIRRQLITQAESDVRNLQRQLEEGAEHIARSGSSTRRTEHEQILRLYRDNALTAVLDPNFAVDEVNDRELQRAAAIAASPAAAPETARGPVSWTRPQRRVVLPPAEE